MLDWNGLSTSQNINYYIPDNSNSGLIQFTTTDKDFKDGAYIKMRVYYNS